MRINANSECLNRFVEFAQKQVLDGHMKSVARMGEGGRVSAAKAGDRTFDRSYALSRTAEAKAANAEARETFAREIAKLFPPESYPNGIPKSVKKLMAGFQAGSTSPLTARRIIAVVNEVQRLRSEILTSGTDDPKRLCDVNGKIAHKRFIDQKDDFLLTGQLFKERVEYLAKTMNKLAPNTLKKNTAANCSEQGATACVDEDNDCAYNFTRFHQGGGGGNHCFFLSALHHLGLEDSNANAAALRELFRASLLELKEQVKNGKSAVRTENFAGMTDYVMDSKDGQKIYLSHLFAELNRTLSFDSEKMADITLSALLAHHLQRPVVVYTTQDGESGPYNVTKFDRDIFTGKPLEEKSVYIWYRQNSHFEAMEPQEQGFEVKLEPIDLKSPFNSLMPEDVGEPMKERMIKKFQNVVASQSTRLGSRGQKMKIVKTFEWLSAPSQANLLKDIKNGFLYCARQKKEDDAIAMTLKEPAREQFLNKADNDLDAQLDKIVKYVLAQAENGTVDGTAVCGVSLPRNAREARDLFFARFLRAQLTDETSYFSRLFADDPNGLGAQGPTFKKAFLEMLDCKKCLTDFENGEFVEGTAALHEILKELLPMTDEETRGAWKQVPSAEESDLGSQTTQDLLGAFKTGIRDIVLKIKNTLTMDEPHVPGEYRGHEAHPVPGQVAPDLKKGQVFRQGSNTCFMMSVFNSLDSRDDGFEFLKSRLFNENGIQVIKRNAKTGKETVEKPLVNVDTGKKFFSPLEQVLFSLYEPFGEELDGKKIHLGEMGTSQSVAMSLGLLGSTASVFSPEMTYFQRRMHFAKAVEAFKANPCNVFFSGAHYTAVTGVYSDDKDFGFWISDSMSNADYKVSLKNTDRIACKFFSFGET